MKQAKKLPAKSLAKAKKAPAAKKIKAVDASEGDDDLDNEVLQEVDSVLAVNQQAVRAPISVPGPNQPALHQSTPKNDPRSNPAHNRSQIDQDDFDDQDEGGNDDNQHNFNSRQNSNIAPANNDKQNEQTGKISLNLSTQLLNKLKYLARDEGINVESLIQEFLAESVVLRAWEIIERKSAMRGGNQGNQAPQGNNRFGGGNNNNNRHRGNNRNNNNNQRRGGPAAGGNWMEDKAAFLEYVRNQEKRRR